MFGIIESKNKGIVAPPGGIESSGLIAMFNFQETSGTSVISEVSGFQGTNSGATINQSGMPGKSYSFDGTNDFIDMNTKTLIGGKSVFTFGIWFKANSLPQDGKFIYGAWASAMFLRFQAGGLQFTTVTSNGRIDGQFFDFSDTTNYHLAVCEYDGAKMRMRLDNQLHATEYSQTGTLNVPNANERIASLQGSSSSYGNINVSQMFVYNRILDQAGHDKVWNNGNGTLLIES